MIVNDRCTIVFVPCFSGAPWNLKQMKHITRRPMRTIRLPEGEDNIEEYSDHLRRMVRGLNSYVIVGDSFGAIVALVFASRQPDGLKGLVLSGGFPVKSVTEKLLHSRPASAKLLPTLLYKSVTLRDYAESVSSPYDVDAEVPWNKEKTLALLEKNMPARSYNARLRAASTAEYSDILPLVHVPTLVLTPSEDKLFGRNAAGAILKGLPNAEGIIIRNSGLMFRHTHPLTFSKVIERFMLQHVDPKDKIDLAHLKRIEPLDDDTTQIFVTDNHR